MQLRIGQGYDLHSFIDADVSDKRLILGGVQIPCDKKLKGHSDADALLHAIADALLGALALGDLGSYFPDTDPQFKNMPSSDILSQCYAKVTELGYELCNLDSTVITEAPKLKKYIHPMRNSISKILELDMDRISVKATTNEKQDSVGQGKALAVQAIVLLKQKN